jgi:hypothetical protein
VPAAPGQVYEQAAPGSSSGGGSAAQTAAAKGVSSSRCWSSFTSSHACSDRDAVDCQVQAQDALHGGFNVRMGVASGSVPTDTHTCRCALMQLAKGTGHTRLSC